MAKIGDTDSNSDGRYLKDLYLKTIEKLRITPDNFAYRAEHFIRKFSFPSVSTHIVNGKITNISTSLDRDSITWKSLLRAFRIISVCKIDIKLTLHFASREPLELDTVSINLQEESADGHNSGNNQRSTGRHNTTRTKPK